MKIKKIASLCKQDKQLNMLLTEDGPWIGTSYAMYFTPELKGIGEDGIYAVLDIPEDKKHSIPISYVAEDKMDTSDINEAVKDCPLDRMRLRIEFGGELMPLLESGGKVMLVRPRYLSPLPSDVECYKRNGLIYVKRGMCLLAIITPIINTSEELLTELEYVTAHIRELIQQE